MKILEVREGFIKFESEERVAISSFWLIKGVSRSYVAQVVQQKELSNCFDVYAKILFLYDDNLLNYDNSLPSKDAEISEFDFNMLSKTFQNKMPIVAGFYADTDKTVVIDKSSFDKKMLVCSDKAENTNTIVSNFAQQFDRVLTIDTLGISTGTKYVAGVDFKLPLNEDSLGFMYQDCLNDATSESKNLIKEIFQELAAYSKTVKFVPFGTLKAIVDDMVDKSHVFKLLILKNKLSKFDNMGYFAQTVIEAENLDQILAQKNVTIDLSKLDTVFQNRYIEVIYSTLEKCGASTQIFLEAANTVDKRNLKKILTSGLATTFVTHSNFKYLNEIKSFFSNYIICPSFTANNIFKTYSIFLNSTNDSSYLIAGECTNYIPLISSTRILPEVDSDKDVLSDTNNEVASHLIEESNNAHDNDCTEIAEDDNDSLATIDQKSQTVIDKVSEEIQNNSMPSELNIFDEEESIEDTVEENELPLSDDIENSEEESVIYDDELQPNLEMEYGDALSAESDNDSLLEKDLEDSDVIQAADSESINEPVDNSSEQLITSETSDEFHTNVDEVQTIQIPEDISDIAEECDTTELTMESVSQQPEQIHESDENDSVVLESVHEQNIELDNETNETVIADDDLDSIAVTENSADDFDEIIEIDDADISEGDIIVDFGDDTELESEEVNREIIEDVDKVFTTIKDESISDSDLDFIDELNELPEEESQTHLSEGLEELTDLQDIESDDDGFLEQQTEEIQDYILDADIDKNNKGILETKNSSTPIVPVYNADIPAEDMVVSDPIEQGDTVVHAKYGNGVVEKMIKYGTKTLYSINFDNIGRRLLDPTLTEIKKA